MHQIDQALSIRPASYKDAEEMCAEMNPADLQNFSFFEKKVTLERQRAYLAAMTSSIHDQLFVIMYSGLMIGTCGLHEIDLANQNARLGVMIFSAGRRGNGFGSGAIRLLLKYAFETLRLQKVYLKVFAENTVSCTKYAHLGFQFEARLRKHYLLKGEFHDMVVMSTFADERAA